jgi:hypothetical protein
MKTRRAALVSVTRNGPRRSMLGVVRTLFSQVAQEKVGSPGRSRSKLSTRRPALVSEGPRRPGAKQSSPSGCSIRSRKGAAARPRKTARWPVCGPMAWVAPGWTVSSRGWLPASGVSLTAPGRRWHSMWSATCCPGQMARRTRTSTACSSPTMTASVPTVFQPSTCFSSPLGPRSSTLSRTSSGWRLAPSLGNAPAQPKVQPVTAAARWYDAAFKKLGSESAGSRIRTTAWPGPGARRSSRTREARPAGRRRSPSGAGGSSRRPR